VASRRRIALIVALGVLVGVTLATFEGGMPLSVPPPPPPPPVIVVRNGASVADPDVAEEKPANVPWPDEPATAAPRQPEPARTKPPTAEPMDSPDWPMPNTLSARGAWVWVQCSGADDLSIGTAAAHLLAAAVELDLNVMFCGEDLSGVPAAGRDRAARLPAGARRLFDGGAARDARAYLEQIARFAFNVTACRHVLLLNRGIDVGGAAWPSAPSASAVTATLRQMLSYQSTEYAATPRLVQRRRGRDATIFTHGRDFHEVAGGRYTLSTRLNGAAEKNGASRVSAPVACASGVVLVARTMLMRAVAAAVTAWDASPAEWQLPKRTAQSTHTVMDVALAALRLPAVQAVPVSMFITVLPRWERAWATYSGFALNMSRGGDSLSGLNALLPRAMTFDASRGRDARRGNTAAEAAVAKNVSLLWEIHEDVMCLGCNGFTVEATNSILAVQSRLQTRAVVWPHCWCPGLLPYHQHTLAQTVHAKAGSGDETFGDTPEAARRTEIWVSHAPLGMKLRASFPYLSARRKRPLAIEHSQRPAYVVSRIMVEVDRVSRTWALEMNGSDLDEVWVPAQFLKDGFYRSGVKRSKPIFVVPDGIDHHAYDPAVVEPSLLIAGDERYKGHYKFFSNFKWHLPKGYDILLKAYFMTFTKADKVVLFIKTFLFGELGDRQHSRELAEARVKDYIENTLRCRADDMPAYVLLVQPLPVDEMRGLYRAADCFVLPTRGEGWGLPFQEAMAMGLPTIGTNWGGNIQFMNATNSLLIDLEGLEDAADPNAPLLPANDTSNRMKPHRARPSLFHTAQLMRWAFDNREKARAIGAVAREHIVRYFSLEAHAQCVMDRVADIQRRDLS
jgi:glycosyltransferase involved in cell wall biosynthesis